MKIRAFTAFIALMAISMPAFGQYVDEGIYGSSDPYGSSSDDIYYTAGQKEAKAKAEAAERARREAEKKARLEAEAQKKAEAEAKAKREAEEKARLEADAKAKAEAAEQARLEAAEKAKDQALAKEGAEKNAAPHKEKAKGNRYLISSVVVGSVGGTLGITAGAILMVKAVNYAENTKTSDVAQHYSQIRINRLAKTGRHLEIGSYIAFGTAGAAVATAIALGVHHQKHKKDKKKKNITLSPTVGKQTALLTISGSW